MPFFRFRFLRVRGGLGQRTVRRVWRSLLPEEFRERNAFAQASEIHRCRRKQLGKLRQVGWTSVDTPSRLVFAMNCPPVDVMTDRKGLRLCRFRYWCPYCWARSYVLEPFRRFSHLLRHPQTLPAGCRVWEVQQVFAVDRYEASVAELHRELCTFRGEFLRKSFPRSVGSFSLVAIEPDRRDPLRWLLHQRALVVTAAGFRPKRVLPLADRELLSVDAGRCATIPAQKIRGCGVVPGLEEVAAAVARVGASPAGLLYGDAEAVLRVIEGRQQGSRGRRGSAFTGLLRALPPVAEGG